MPIRIIPLLVCFLVQMLGPGCGRDFAAPPDQPPTLRIEALHPLSGFTGEAVAVCAAHLDEQADNNRIHFDVVSAQVIGFEAPADWTPDESFSCTEQTLWVRVPVLPDEGEKIVQATNDTGQSTAEQRFTYLGPGHPVAGVPERVLHLRAGLGGVFTPPNGKAPLYGAVSHDAATMSLFEPNLGLHLDFGLCDMPLSGAAAVTDAWKSKIFVSSMQLGEQDGLDVQVSMLAWEIDLELLLTEYRFLPPVEVYLPSTSDRQPFQPLLLWSYPRANQDTPNVIKHDLVATHALRPALALISADDPDQAQVIELPDQAPWCSADSSERLGQIIDLVFEPQGRDFYLALSGSNEIWRVGAESHQVDRVWPPEDPTGFEALVQCNWINSALAIRRSHEQAQHMRLYVADANSRRIREFQPLLQPDGVWIPNLHAAAIDATPYSMTTGLYHAKTDLGADITGERLYVATQNGLVVMDVSARRPFAPGDQDWIRVGEIPLPSNRGGPQGLAIDHQYNLVGGTEDILLLADSAGDLVRTYTVGAEQPALGDTTVGATLPNLSVSARSDRLYMTDSLSNAVHLVDPISGMRQAQFLIADLDDHDYMGFLSNNLETLRQDHKDLLVIPLIEFDPSERNGRNRYERFATGWVGEAPPSCALTQTGLGVDDSVGERFDEMHVLRWNLLDQLDVPTLLLVRYHDEVDLIDEAGQPAGTHLYEARTWGLEITTKKAGDPLVTVGADPIGSHSPAAGSGEEVRMVRPAAHVPAIAQLESFTNPDGARALDLRLVAFENGPWGAGVQSRLALDPTFEPYVTDLLVQHVGRDGQADFRVYVALATVGRIGVAHFPTDGSDPFWSFIDTGGEPLTLSISPDGRRLYAVHVLKSRIDILRTDCPADESCLDELISLDVEAGPYQVAFSDTGRQAYLLHLFSNNITVIK